VKDITTKLVPGKKQEFNNIVGLLVVLFSIVVVFLREQYHHHRHHHHHQQQQRLVPSSLGSIATIPIPITAPVLDNENDENAYESNFAVKPRMVVLHAILSDNDNDDHNQPHHHSNNRISQRTQLLSNLKFSKFAPPVVPKDGIITTTNNNNNSNSKNDDDNNSDSSNREATNDKIVNLSDSHEYGKKPESMYSTDPPCEPQYDWQLDNRPSCNLFHEFDLTQFTHKERRSSTATSKNNNNARIDERPPIELFRFVASGGYRDVYSVLDQHVSSGAGAGAGDAGSSASASASAANGGSDKTITKLALKTLKWSRDFTERHFDRHRRDAVVADRLTALKTNVDIYGYCGQSALYEFAQGGDLKHAIQKHITKPKTKQDAWDSAQKLKVAYQIAQALADVHNVDMEGKASIAHTDISTGQFIDIRGDGNFKINDFNRGRLLSRNTVNGTVCPFRVKSNKGKFRSPEEYLYLPETEKIDVYSMGNIFWVLLHGKYPFAKTCRKGAKKAVIKGHRPPFEEAIIASEDKNIQALVEATRMCWEQDPDKRASAREVLQFLQSKI